MILIKETVTGNETAIHRSAGQQPEGKQEAEHFLKKARKSEKLIVRRNPNATKAFLFSKSKELNRIKPKSPSLFVFIETFFSITKTGPDC